MSLPAYYASLRVFVPIAALPADEREKWERYVAAGLGRNRGAVIRAERAMAVAAAVRPRLGLEDERHGEQAIVDVVDGITYVCPLRTEVRAWYCARQFRTALPAVLADAFLPPELGDQAEVGLARWERQEALAVHVRTNAWTVPIAWFVPFAPDERIIESEPAPQVRYVTGMSSARRRIARALQILQRTLPDAPAGLVLTDVGRWLEEFHPHSRVELDYGDLATLLDADQLAADISVADLVAGLDGLRDGEPATAAMAYERVLARWRPMQLRETAS